MLDPLKNARLKDRQTRVSEDRFSDAALQTPAQERIEKAADDLFSKNGVRLVTIEDIADRAETNSAFVLECSGSLQHLIADYLQRRIAEDDSWHTLEVRYPHAPEKQLRSWIRSAAPDPKGPIIPLPLSAEAIELGYQPGHPAYVIIGRNKAALRDKLAGLCSDALYRDPEGLAEKLLFLVEGAFVQRMLFGGEERGSRLIEAAEDLLKRHSEPK